MLAMGGALKRKEKISGRLGDVLSMLYLVSATLKRYEDQGRVKEDLPLVRWAVRDALYHAQQAIDGILSNFPVKSLATLLRWTIFPLRHAVAPAARLAQPRVRAASRSSPARRATASPPACTCPRASDATGGARGGVRRRRRRRADRREAARGA